MSLTDWAVITVTHNSADDLQRCWAHRVPEDLLWIVVDNASQDNSATVARSMGAQVIQMNKNVGFSAGCNIGARASDRELLLFANPDLRIVPDDLAALETSVRQGDGLSSPRLMNEDGSLQANARGVPYVVNKLASRGLRLPGANLKDYLWPEPSRVAWLMGAAVATTKVSLMSVGGWPERYFVYFEDHDLGLRYCARGLPVRCLESVQWVHTWARTPVKARTRQKLRAMKMELASGAKFYWHHPNLILGSLGSPRNERRAS